MHRRATQSRPERLMGLARDQAKVRGTGRKGWSSARSPAGSSTTMKAAETRLTPKARRKTPERQAQGLATSTRLPSRVVDRRPTGCGSRLLLLPSATAVA